MSAHDDEDLPRDAWLREALRHAPDADAAPPPRLNETILRMGRAAVAPREERKPAAAPPRPSGTTGDGGALASSWASLWAWLSRPPVAAGFAVVFLSTVVGVMWMGRPLEDSLPPREETVAAAPPAAPAADATVERAREAPAMPEAARRAADAATRVAAAPALPAPKAEPPTPKAEPPAPKAEPAPARKAEVPPAAAKVEAAPAPATVATAQGAAAAPQAANDMAARELASAERREAPAARMAAAAPPPAAPAASAIETPSLSNLRFEIRRKPDSWSWQRDDGAARPMDDAMQDWIAQADRTSRPAWQHGAAAGAAVTTTLRFTRDGVVRAVLRLGPSGMQLTRGGKTESVELSRGAAAALQSSLDALGP